MTAIGEAGDLNDESNFEYFELLLSLNYLSLNYLFILKKA